MFLIAFGLALATAHAPATSITLDEAAGVPSTTLSHRLLPPDVAVRIVGGQVRRMWFPAQGHYAAFWEKSVPAGATLCRQRRHGVSLENALAPSHSNDADILLRVRAVESGDWVGSSYPAPATHESCAKVKGYAALRPGRWEATMAALHQLNEAMRVASAKAPLPFRLSCKGEDGDESCADTRAALASLPLDALFRISFDAGTYIPWNFTQSTKGSSGISLSGMAPMPTRRAPSATVAFGMSGKDGKSWSATLIGSPGPVEEVRLWRSMVTYH